MNKKGFTLIELLAIIVILAIIAVITVPLILGVIEDSKEGAAKDSALGYKKAVEQYYATELMNSNIDGLPTASLSVSEMPNNFNVIGESPSDGWIELENGEVIAYSLVYGEYVVEYDGTTGPTVAKATELDPCPGCVFVNDTTRRYIYGSPESSGKTTTLSAGEYTTDYTTIIDGNNNQVNYFLGHKIDNDGKILKSYACGLKNGTLFCLEGYDSTKYNSNKRILNKVFSDCESVTIAGVEEYDCDQSGLNAIAQADGTVYTGFEGCVVHGNGETKCAPRQIPNK